MTTSRLDLVLAARYPDFTRSRLKGLVDAGFVLVNGVTADKPGMKVRDTDEIEVEFPPPVPAEPEPEPIPLAVVYEDDDLIVVDKPPGLVVHPSPGHFALMAQKRAFMWEIPNLPASKV